MAGYKYAIKRAFPYTIPVLTGYLFIGIAFGVMFAEKGYSFHLGNINELDGICRIGTISGREFFCPGGIISSCYFYDVDGECQACVLGFSLLERFHSMGKKRWYMIFGLTDETYSLLCTTKVPSGVEEEKFLFVISMMNQSYWVIGSAIGGIAGSLLPFNSEGIDFAMTALFVVIFVEQWMEKKIVSRN